MRTSDIGTLFDFNYRCNRQILADGPDLEFLYYADTLGGGHEQ